MVAGGGLEPPHERVWTACLKPLGYPAMAPRVGLEPTTYRLTAGCSTIELSRIVFGGEGGIWTLAAVTHTNGLANRPLQPLEYFSIVTYCFNGAEDGTWTRTVLPTRPSSVRVCQFRHSRILMEPLTGIEPVTLSLPRIRSADWAIWAE